MNPLRSPLFLILLLALLACNTTERVVRFSPDNTAAMLVSTNDVANLQSQYGNVDGVYLTYNHTLEHNVSIAFTSTIPHWKFYEIVDRSHVVFNANNPELNAFRLDVPKQSKLEQVLITVQAPGMSSTVYQKSDLLEDVDAEGNMTYSMNYSGIQPGTVISEKYEVVRGDLERNPPTMHDVPLQHTIPVQDLNFQYVYPIWWQVQVKNLSLNQPLNYERVEDAERRKIILRYSSQNVPAFDNSPGSPYFKQVAPYFQLQVTNLSMGSALRERSPEDWTAFAKDYKGFTTEVNDRPSRSIQKNADQLVGHLINDVDRVETILNYVSDNIRIDPNSRQRNLDMVLARREGNAFMVSGLMQAMLAAKDIDSEYLLVHPAEEGYFDPEFYSEVQLNEPALGVFVEGVQYYVFPGLQRSLTDPIPVQYAGQPAMVITSDGFGGFTEVYSDQTTQPAPPPMIVDRGSTGTQRDPVQQPTESMPPPQPTTQQQPTNTLPPVNTTPPPVNTTPPANNSPIGSPIGQPIGTPTTQEPTPEIVETLPPPSQEPNALPEWLGSIKRSVGGWTWVIASRTTMDEAEQFANQYVDLYRQGLSLDVLSGESNGVIRYRIAVGQYPSRNLATTDRNRLGSILPGDAWMLEVKPDM